VGNPCQSLDVTDVASRISDTFTEYSSGVLVDHPLHVGGTIGFGKPSANPEAPKEMGEKRVGSAV
jgi:hypothetical protein